MLRDPASPGTFNAHPDADSRSPSDGPAAVAPVLNHQLSVGKVTLVVGEGNTERFREIANDEELADEFAMNQEIAELDSETETFAPAVSEDAASGESTDEQKQDASSDDAAN